MRYTPTKIFRGNPSTAADCSLWVAPSLTIIKNILITNPSNSSVTFGMGTLDGGFNLLDPLDAINGVGSWVGTATLAASVTPLALSVTATSTTAWSIETGLYGVCPSSTLYWSFGSKAAATSRVLTLYVQFYTNEGVAIGSATSLGTVTDNTSNFSSNSSVVVAPSNAYFAQLLVTISAVANSEIHYLSGFSLVQAPLLTGTPGAPGNLSPTRTLYRFFPDIALTESLTTLDVSLVMNPGDALTAKSTASMNVYVSGVVSS